MKKNAGNMYAALIDLIVLNGVERRVATVAGYTFSSSIEPQRLYQLHNESTTTGIYYTLSGTAPVFTVGVGTSYGIPVPPGGTVPIYLDNASGGASVIVSCSSSVASAFPVATLSKARDYSR